MLHSPPLAPLLSGLCLLVAPTVLASPPDEATDATLELRGLELSRASAASIAPWLDHEEPELGRQAARALGRLHDPTAVPPLLRALASADAPLRAEAAFALGQYPDTASALLEALTLEEHPAVRAALLDALGRTGDLTVVAMLTASLDDDSPGEALAACHAVGRLGVRGELVAPPPALVGLLLDQLSQLDLDRRRAAAFALARTKPAALSPELADRLQRAAVRQPDAIARAWLVRASATGLDADAWVAVQAAAAKDAALGVRIALARGLATRGDEAAPEALQALLEDPDRPVRIAALEAAARLPWSTSWETPMQAMLEIGDPELQARALPLLALAGALAEPEGWLNPTVDSAIRAAMMVTVDDPEALAAYAMDDISQAVRTSATEQLLSQEPTVDRALLWPLLQHPDPVVAGLVASTLAEAPDAELIGRIQLQLVERIDYDGLVGMIEALTAALEASGVTSGAKPPSLPGSTQAQVAVRMVELQSHDDPGLRAAAGRLGPLLGLPPAGPAAFPRLVGAEALDTLLGARVRTSQGELALSFHTDEAPYAVQRWVELAEAGYFEGLRFHRIVPDFVVQGGCPRGDGYGGPGYALPDELSPLPYRAWSVGMASAGPDTAGSQWFITLSPQPHLDGDYTLFAELVKGEDVLRRLRQDDRIEDVVIERRETSETDEHP